MTEELYARLLPVFLEEADRMTQQMDDAIATLAIAPADDDARRRLARAAHTLKGNAAMLGLSGLVAAARAVEDGWPFAGTATAADGLVSLDFARIRVRAVLTEVEANLALVIQR